MVTADRGLMVVERAVKGREEVSRKHIADEME